nr:ORF1b [Carpet python nidovirus 1]
MQLKPNKPSTQGKNNDTCRQAPRNAPAGKKLVSSAVKQVTGDFELVSRQVSDILQKPDIYFGLRDDEQPDSKGRWVNVCQQDSGIKRLQKCRTISIEINHRNHMLKTGSEKSLRHEYNQYLVLKDSIAIPEHQLVELDNGSYVLIRGPVSNDSLGDLVYSHFHNSNEEAPEIPDKGKPSAQAICDALAERLEPAFENLDRLRAWCLKYNVQLPITLDNIDMSGQLYDFEDINTSPHNIDIALGDFMRLWSLTNRPPPEVAKKWFPVKYNLHECSWLEKVLQVNNNLLHAKNTNTEIFIDASSNTTSMYHNDVTGTHTIDSEQLNSCSDFLQNLYYLQDPGLHWRKPVITVGNRVNFAATTDNHETPANRPVYYNEEAFNFFESRLGNIDSVLDYTYFQGDNANCVNDFLYYDYQGRLFLQPHLVKFLYERTRKDFSSCATDVRFSKLECTPRKSSLGPSHTLLRSYKQDQIYTAAPDNFIEELVNLSQQSALIFSTKCVQKFALTAKPRARTIAACSMTASTLFRALHKPVTANFVTQTQKQGTEIHHLIGVSKFRGGFHNWFTSRHGDISNWKVFGSDYTKCDRSFPLVFRSMAAALLFDLGGWDPHSHHFTNEMHAFMFDIVHLDGKLVYKPGGTSSGDATTAFANTLYNHGVHLLVQLQTLVTQQVHQNHLALKVAAVKGFQTGDFDDYNAMLDHYNKTQYKFNFLSDDSFILTNIHDKTLPDIYNKHNFSKHLETIIHTTVDQNKAWESEGDLHEFCSSTVKPCNGILQYIPDKHRLLAALCIEGKASTAELRVVRTAAILAEGVIYSQVDLNFWRVLWEYFENQLAEFIEQYGVLPIPDKMTEAEFYYGLIDPDKSPSDMELFQSVLADWGIKDVEMQAKNQVQQQCYTCHNPTVSTCIDCPVAYPLCCYCACTHYNETGHKVTHLPVCSHPGCGMSDPECMNFSLDNGQFTIRCDEHNTTFSIKVYDNKTQSFRLPLNQYCVKQESTVSNISKTIDNFTEGDFFSWNVDESKNSNMTRLLHESYLNDQYSAEQDIIFDYTVLDIKNNEVMIKDASYGLTTYCNILDSNGKIKLNCTVDPLRKDVYRLTFLDDTKRFINFDKIQRSNRVASKTDLSLLDVFKRTKFILGPPGTGKTTYFIENYFSKQRHNKVVYAAPTHKLVQDMDEALKGNSNVTVYKGKYNNREYHAPIDDESKPLVLCTVNIVRPIAGCVLLIDECSLLSPKQLFDAIIRSRAGEVICVGDPFQLSPVTPVTDFCWDYETFYLRQLVPQYNQTVLSTCYRCPRNIFNIFAGAYHNHNIEFNAAKEGGTVNWHRLKNDGIVISQKVLQEADNAGLDIVLVNYKQAAIDALNLKTRFVTIDSAQGLTVGKVGVIIFGSTKFSKVLNRLIVATSRATQQLDIWCCASVEDHIREHLCTKTVTPQALLTRPNCLTEVDIQTVASNIEATAVCDIEFYHAKHPTRSIPNFLGLGEINCMTSRSTTTFLRPHYNRDGDYLEVEDSYIRVSKEWKYMLRHLPNYADSDMRRNHFLHFLNDTTNLSNNPLIFVLFNGTNDLDALAEITTPAGTCHCGKPARFTTNTDEDVCQEHCNGKFLVAVAGGMYFNIRSTSNLTTIHGVICGKYHGAAHNANNDVVMTACLLDDMLKQHTPSTEGPTKHDEFGTWRKVKPCLDNPNDRVYGSTYYHKSSRVNTSNAGAISNQMPVNKEHTDSYVIIPPAMRIKACHAVSRIHCCTACLNHGKNWLKTNLANIQQGWQLEDSNFELQLTQYEKQLKLSAEVVETPMGLRVRLGGHTGVTVNWQGSLDQTICKYNHEVNQPLPIKEVLNGLAINCTVNCSHHAVPITTEDRLNDWDTPLVVKPILHKGTQYVCKPAGKGSDNTKAFVLGMDDWVRVNYDELPRYQLTRLDNNVEVELEHTLYSTGRLATQDYWTFPSEESTDCAHIELGDYNDSSLKIGGMHMFPKAFENASLNKVEQEASTPLWHANIVAKQGTKLHNSLVDVEVTRFISTIKDKLTTNTISTRTTIRIDHQNIPIMIWATAGKIDTAYLQNGGPDVVLPATQKCSQSYIQYKPVIRPYKTEVLMNSNIAHFEVLRNRLNQAANITKYVQLCNYLNDNVKVPPKTRVLHLGAATGPEHDQIPVGGVVLNHFFTNCDVYHHDIRPINNCNGRFKVGLPEGKVDLIISDIWNYNEDTDGEWISNHEMLINYVNQHLHLGGSIIWKTTRRSNLSYINYIASHFGQVDYMTTRGNASSSEMFVVFKYFKQEIKQPQEKDRDCWQILHHLFAYRHQHRTYVRQDSLNCDTISKYKSVYRVPKFLEGRIEKSSWASGNFIQQNS